MEIEYHDKLKDYRLYIAEAFRHVHTMTDCQFMNCIFWAIQYVSDNPSCKESDVIRALRIKFPWIRDGEPK